MADPPAKAQRIRDVTFLQSSEARSGRCGQLFRGARLCKVLVRSQGAEKPRVP